MTKTMEQCKRIAIMGGTFDPIHYGHLVAAEAVRQELSIEKVLFVPTGRPPHKTKARVSDGGHRYLMSVIATASNPFFEVSRLEIDRTGTTYTIDTVTELKNRYPGARLYFITGADAIHQILTWKEAERLLTLCDFVAVTRPGYNREKLNSDVSHINGKYRAKLHVLEIPALAISSTDIRNRVKILKTIKYLLPEEVEKYIMKAGLYIDNADMDKEILKINKRIYKMLTPVRFAHTQGVCEEAVRLAEKYGVDRQKAIIAALLHDCAKNIPENETRRLCKKYDIKLDDILDKQIYLAHSFLGAKIAKHEFNVSDKEILNAIKYHTTGRSNMSVLEKVIYIADYIEPNREYFDGLSELRVLAYEDLDKAMHLGLKINEENLTLRGRIIHPLSVEALDYYKGEI